MTIKNLKNAESFSNFAFDGVCVVGGGIAGLLLARRLARGGQGVVVIESGVDAFDEAIHALNEIEDLNGRYSRALTGRYRGLGGTSSRWGGRMIPLSEHDFGARQHVSQPAWPFPVASLDSYHEEIERLFGVGGGGFDDIEAGRWPGPEAFPKETSTLKPRWAKCPSFVRCNIATTLRNELQQLKNIQIWLGATVCDFELDREAGRVTAITAREFGGRKLTVRADRFVFAAGSIETTRLLLLLDAASNGQAFRRCKVLGRYFQDHLKAEVATISRSDPVATNNLFAYRFVKSTRRDLHLELSQAMQRKDKAASAFVYVAMDLDHGPLADLKRVAHGLQRRQVDLAGMGRVLKNPGTMARAAYWRLVRNQLFVPADVDLRLLVCAEQLPQWSNRIRLSQQRDRLGAQKVLLEWSPTADDERTFRSAVAGLEGYWREAGFDRLCPLVWSEAAEDRSIPLIDQAEACAHPSGSTRMGTDPEQSVVGPDLFCHAVPNVAVISASVFPTAGSANPTFTIMKLALWLADSCLQTATTQLRASAPVAEARAFPAQASPKPC